MSRQEPWKLSEGKARKVGLLFEGENAIRKFWEEHVRPKLSDEFYTRRNVDCIFWVDEARKILGFDGPDYKDRFATVRRFNQIHAAKITAAGNAVGAPEAVASTTAVHVGSPPSGVVVTNAAESDPGGMPISGARPKKRKSSNRSSSSSASGLSCYGIGEDPQKKKKKSEKKKKRKPTNIHNAPWIHAKEQAELFESLYARVSVLSDSQLRQASDLLRRGNPQMIGLVKAYVGKEADEASKKQFKRVLMTLFG
eukprot:evm.model.NODE_4201_length_13017_cov_21.102097.3